jgi:hypothetical protein
VLSVDLGELKAGGAVGMIRLDWRDQRGDEGKPARRM